MDVASELVEELGDGDEVDVVTLGHGLHAERYRQVGLADAGWAKEDDVLAVGEEAQGGEFLDLFAVDRRLKAEVEVGQGLVEREVGEPGLGQQPALGAAGGIGLEQPVEEVDMAERVLGWLLADGVQELGNSPQLEPVEVSDDALAGDVHTNAS